MLALSILVPLYLSTAIVVSVRAWRWRSDISLRFRRSTLLPILGVFTSFLYALSAVFSSVEPLAFFGFFLHRAVGAFATFVFLYLIQQSLGFCNVSQHRYQRVTHILHYVAVFVLFTVVVQTFVFMFNRMSRLHGSKKLKFDDEPSWQRLDDLIDSNSLRHDFTGPPSTLTLHSDSDLDSAYVDPEVLAEALREIEPSLSIEDVAELQTSGHVEFTQPDQHVDFPDPEFHISRVRDDDFGSKPPWPFVTIATLATWVSLALKLALVVIASILKRTDARDQGVNKELTFWLVCGSVALLIQEPLLLRLCFAFTRRVRVIESFLDPLLFVLVQESIIGVGYWNNDENLDAEEAARFEQQTKWARMWSFQAIPSFGPIRL